MPEGVDADLLWLEFGGLRVGLASRQTLITLKLFAAADQDPSSVHAQDLRALAPTDDELARARAAGSSIRTWRQSSQHSSTR